MTELDDFSRVFNMNMYEPSNDGGPHVPRIHIDKGKEENQLASQGI